MMTKEEFQKIATQKLEEVPTFQLIEVVKKFNNDFSCGVDCFFEAALEVLMHRLSEKEFIKLCKELM